MHSRKCSSHFSIESFELTPSRPSSETTPSVDELSISGGEELLAEFVSAAKKGSVKALISVGGVSTPCFDRPHNDLLKWAGSRFFSTAVGSAANRTAFVETITNLVEKHKLDGVDFEWVLCFANCSRSRP